MEEAQQTFLCDLCLQWLWWFEHRSDSLAPFRFCVFNYLPVSAC